MIPSRLAYQSEEEYIKIVLDAINDYIQARIEKEKLNKLIFIDISNLFINVNSINLDKNMMESILVEYKKIGWNHISCFYFSSFIWRHEIWLSEFKFEEGSDPYKYELFK